MKDNNGNRKKYGVLILSAILTIAGFVRLKTSVNGGLEAADNYLVSAGGTMDSEQFNVIQHGYIVANIVLGGALFVIGLGFLCFSIYRFLREAS